MTKGTNWGIHMTSRFRAFTVLGAESCDEGITEVLWYEMRYTVSAHMFGCDYVPRNGREIMQSTESLGVVL